MLIPSRSEVLLFGIPFAQLSLEETLSVIFERLESPSEGRGDTAYIATVNIQFIFNIFKRCQLEVKQVELLEILRQAFLVTADGMPLVWLSRLLGCPLPERVAGSDLVPRLVERAAQTGKSVFFLGGAPGVALDASLLLKKQFPSLKVAGVASPFLSVTGEGLLDDQSPLLQEINASSADILLIGFGNPKQEIWFNLVRDQLSVKVAIGVGGTFNFITGKVSRAPLWMQKISMEWLFRFFQEPQRLWKRYLLDILPLCLETAALLLFEGLNRYYPCSSSSPSVLSWMNQKEMAQYLRDFPQKNQILSPRLRRWLKWNRCGDLLLPKESRSLKAVDPSPLQGLPATLILSSPEKDFWVLKVVGRLEAKLVRQELASLLSCCSEGFLWVIDLKQCVYLDSGMLQFFLKLKKRKESLGQTLVLEGVSAALRRFLKNAQVETLFISRSTSYTKSKTPHL
jgi:exopolysaccharide biosynthesis WecB/TagA/CpsF family protein